MDAQGKGINLIRGFLSELQVWGLLLHLVAKGNNALFDLRFITGNTTPVPSAANTTFNVSSGALKETHCGICSVKAGYSEGFYSALETYSVNINYKSALI